MHRGSTPFIPRSSTPRQCADGLLALAGWIAEQTDSAQPLVLTELIRGDALLRNIGRDPAFFETAQRVLNRCARRLIEIMDLEWLAQRQSNATWLARLDSNKRELQRSTLLWLCAFVFHRADALLSSCSINDDACHYAALARDDARSFREQLRSSGVQKGVTQ